MYKKKLICVVIAILLVSTVVPVCALAAGGTHWQIAADLSENQSVTFTLPSECPSVYKVEGPNYSATYYDYDHSRWFKIFVSSDNQTIQWTVSGVSGQSFNGEVCVEVSDKATVESCGGCIGYWRFYSAITKTQNLSDAGEYYIHVFGEDLTTELQLQYSLIDSTDDSGTSGKTASAPDNSAESLAAADSENAEEPDTSSSPNNLDSASTWAYAAIERAIAAGYVPADIQNNYTDVITRAEFCRMAVKYMEFVAGKSVDDILAEKGLYRNLNAFTDTDDPDILAAFALGITNGTGERTFTPNGQFSREQAAVMLMNTCRAMGADVSNPPASGFADMGGASSWAVNGINFCYANGIMNGTGNDNFSPKSAYTREQSIITFDNISIPGDAVSLVY